MASVAVERPRLYRRAGVIQGRRGTRSRAPVSLLAASRSVAFTGYRDAGAAAAGPRRRRRATPVRLAASATAAATAGTTRPSNIEGVLYSSESSPLDTMAASACAAASFISSFTRRARTSSIPRKKPGKQHELLIWFG